ncbi:uncharacterized protein F5147DRAFT_711629 [Suillus discolor]|uniref:Uncharacterized protein n=1 Tax=Suillus discolor TaxID=1912936 RepID=A0A9P7JQW2_9AGAM|nr:uncharacterized protein F5147DRAFT_711629 [Suillus discolor]KAG2099550.1 hypothetical protein F5147DRAFT_711629 [Suillus discolor]
MCNHDLAFVTMDWTMSLWLLGLAWTVSKLSALRWPLFFSCYLERSLATCKLQHSLQTMHHPPRLSPRKRLACQITHPSAS